MERQKLVLLIFPIILLAAALFFSTPASATCPEGQVQTNFFGCVEDDEKGCGVWLTINLGITILTYGVAIAATIGLVITAIMYITAHDNVGQLAKAKTRILEIVIGLGIYAAMWTIASWLIPGGIFNGGNVCSTSAATAGPSNTIMMQDKKSSSGISNTSDNDDSDDDGKDDDGKDDSDSKEERSKKKQQAISDAGKELAWPRGTPKSVYENRATKKFKKAMRVTKTNKGESGCRKRGQACGMFVGTVVRYSGVDKKFPTMAIKIYSRVKKSKKWQRVYKKRAGDIVLHYGKSKNCPGGKSKCHHHVSMVVKDGGKLRKAEAGLCDFYGKIRGSTGHYQKEYIYRYVGG